MLDEPAAASRSSWAGRCDEPQKPAPRQRREVAPILPLGTSAGRAVWRQPPNWCDEPLTAGTSLGAGGSITTQLVYSSRCRGRVGEQAVVWSSLRVQTS